MKKKGDKKMITLTAVVKKGEKLFVALCPELDVASQGETIEKAIENLKEAVELYVEEMGVPEELKKEAIVVSHFEVPIRAKTPHPVRPRSR